MFAYLEEWNRLTERIGFWLDLDDAYRTLDESYIESVWWALAQIDARGLLYEGHKVVPYCPRCGTTLSSHEVALGYRDVVDPSVYLKLPVTGPTRPLAGRPPRGRSCWCGRRRRGRCRATSRWRSRRRRSTRASMRTASATCSPRRASRRCSARGRRCSSGSRARELVERYSAYGARSSRSASPAGYPILADDFVTTEDGTGIVHLAPAFGEDDYRVAGARTAWRSTRGAGDAAATRSRRDGTYDERVRNHAGNLRGPLRQGRGR